ncbi:MAG: hypothetical protein QOG82_1541 [Actinomycetota bacterium]|jgi:uncharacterized protein (DUF1015 family)|nr:hypothetical protein [Actinomycetota bacterium]
MARFEPFPGIRYDPERVDLADVLAPPYDVVDDEAAARLEARSPYNAVFVELGRVGADDDRYDRATHHFDDWLAQGILRVDEEPSFYVYRMGWHDDAGVARQTTGILGALELSLPEEGRVLPHERTMGKPKGDRLRLLRASRANLSPVWGLSLAPGLTDLCQVSGPPVGRATDEDGVHHRLWRVTQPGMVSAIADAVGSAPVVIADGHHRYETALAYRDERRAATGDARGDFDLLMALVVELTADQLEVQPIHRIVSGLPDDFDLVGTLAPFFEVEEAVRPPAGDDRQPTGGAAWLTGRMETEGALALVVGERAWLLRARQPTGEPDAIVLDAALAALPDHQLDFHQSAEVVTDLVGAGKAQAAMLVRPVAVSQIAAAARAGHRMPAKTTFFAPKPRTGLVFRRLRD